jgi:pimeloyl-ACP methyl ester carboxylesterase
MLTKMLMSVGAIAVLVYGGFCTVLFLYQEKMIFDSLSRAPGIDTPLLALIGSQDSLVTPDRSRILAQAWKGPSKLQELQGAGHNDLTQHPQFWPSVDKFLESRLDDK